LDQDVLNSLEEAEELADNGQGEEAKKIVVKVMRRATQQGRSDLAAISLSVLGNMELFEDNFPKAEEDLKQALTMQEGEDQSEWKMATLQRLSELYFATDLPIKALRFAVLAQAIAQKLSDPAEVEILAMIGDLSVQVGQFEEACGSYITANDLAQRFEIRDKEVTYDLAYKTGVAYVGCENYEKAQEYMEKALRLSEGLPVQAKADALHQLGHIEQDLHFPSHGVEKLEAALATTDENESKVNYTWDLAMAHSQRGQTDEAVASYLQLIRMARASNDFDNLSDALDTLGRFEYNEDRFEEARTHLRQAERVLRNKIELPERLVEVLLGLCLTEVELGEYSVARKYADECQELAASIHRHDVEEEAIDILDFIERKEKEVPEDTPVEPPTWWKFMDKGHDDRAL
jgi:tetratricopeptide (TPR) repeat protein